MGRRESEASIIRAAAAPYHPADRMRLLLLLVRSQEAAGQCNEFGFIWISMQRIWLCQVLLDLRFRACVIGIRSAYILRLLVSLVAYSRLLCASTLFRAWRVPIARLFLDPLPVVISYVI